MEKSLILRTKLALIVALLAAIAGLAAVWHMHTPRRGQLDGGNGTAFGSGGAALGARAGGFPGMPGCDGGTNPSSDGKFYIPETGQECNPSDDDRRKLK